MPTVGRRHYIAAAVCLAAFITAQTFQELAYRFWIPEARTPGDELLVYLLTLDQARALAILFTVVPLMVPFTVLALRYRDTAPLAATLGLIFGTAFVGFETIHRSMDLFLVGHTWARQFAEAAASADRDAILLRFAHWNEMLRGWFFPQMMSYLLASASFVAATWRDVGRARWYCLAPIAYALNALRLLGRVSSNYLGQSWLNGLNENLYFPGVLVVNTLLVIWFLLVAKHEGTPGAQ